MSHAKRFFVAALGIVGIMSIASLAVAQSNTDYNNDSTAAVVEPSHAAPTPTVKPSNVPRPAPGVKSTTTGAVVSSTGSSLVIRTQDGQQMTFTVDTASSIPTTIATGDRITVTYDTSTSGAQHVVSVANEPTAMPPATNDTYSNPPSSATNDTNRTNEPDTTGTHEPMPKTASYVPLIAILGIVSIGVGIGYTMYLKKSA